MFGELDDGGSEMWEISPSITDPELNTDIVPRALCTLVCIIEYNQHHYSPLQKFVPEVLYFIH